LVALSDGASAEILCITTLFGKQCQSLRRREGMDCKGFDLPLDK